MMSGSKGTGIVWIASYPKSGNTWMRHLLTQLLFGPVASSADLDACIPNVGGAPGEQVYLPKDEAVLLKTHLTYSDRIGLFNQTIGFVYLVRNPLDVMLSFFNFNLLRLMQSEADLTEESIARARSMYVDTFIQNRGNPLVHRGVGHTDWVDNVNGWREASRRYPHVMVRYEDMLVDTAAEMRRVISLLNLDVDEARLQEVVGNSSFDEMKRQEEREIQKRQKGFFFRDEWLPANELGIRFMREGKFNNSLEFLSKAQRSAFRAAFALSMETLGYRFDDIALQVRLRDSGVGGVSPLDEPLTFGTAKVTG